MKTNNHILVIDDEENVRDTIRAMLMPRIRDTTEIDALGEQLFGSTLAAQDGTGSPLLPFPFVVDTAANGPEGLQRVQQALAVNRPYAAIFVDMRMPGWDGLKTVQQIRAYDKQAEVIFITAYSDYAIRDIVARAGMNVSYHCKPFSSDEIQQLAIKSVYEWNKARQLEDLLQVTARLHEQADKPEDMLPLILQHAHEQLGAIGTLFAAPQAGGHWASVVQTGSWTSTTQAQACACAAAMAPDEDDTYAFQAACFCKHFDPFVFVALLAGDAVAPSSDVRYAIRLFMEQAQQALTHARLIERTRNNEKLAAIGAALSMVTHDLRSPVSAIQAASACLLEEEPPDAATTRSLIEGVHRSAQDCSYYMQDLIEFVRGGEPVLAFQPVPCRPFLDELVVEMQGRRGRLAVQFEVAMEPGIVFVMDRIKMRRVLLNLVMNAMEALRDHPVERTPCILLSGGVDADKGWLSVTDNGPGLPQAVRDRLFEFFVTVDKVGGTGLGLAIVKKFADAHQLTIVVDSSPDGTTFTLSGFAEAVA
jgi:two-component system, NtrC family, sensor kinase